MENNEKVNVVSTVKNTIHIFVPELRFNRTWARKGTSIPVEKELLKDLMFNSGVEYMFKTGMLYIEEMQVKKDLGLEPEEATEPTNIIVLNDEQKKRYMTLMPLHDFKKNLENLSNEQIRELVDYAVEKELLPYDKCTYLEKKYGINPIKMADAERKNKED